MSKSKRNTNTPPKKHQAEMIAPNQPYIEKEEQPAHHPY